MQYTYLQSECQPQFANKICAYIKKECIILEKTPFFKCQVGKKGVSGWDGGTKNIRNYLLSLHSKIEKNEGTIPKNENAILKTYNFIN